MFEIKEEKMEKTVIKYELKHEEMEIGYVKFGACYRHGDVACCTAFNTFAYYPGKLTSFDSKEEALSELKRYHSSVRSAQGQLGTLLFAEEYWVESNQYNIDEDGDFEFDQMIDIIEIAPLA